MPKLTIATPDGPDVYPLRIAETFLSRGQRVAEGDPLITLEIADGTMVVLRAPAAGVVEIGPPIRGTIIRARQYVVRLVRTDTASAARAAASRDAASRVGLPPGRAQAERARAARFGAAAAGEDDHQPFDRAPVKGLPAVARRGSPGEASGSRALEIRPAGWLSRREVGAAKAGLGWAKRHGGRSPASAIAAGIAAVALVAALGLLHPPKPDRLLAGLRATDRDPTVTEPPALAGGPRITAVMERSTSARPPGRDPAVIDARILSAPRLIPGAKGESPVEYSYGNGRRTAGPWPRTGTYLALGRYGLREHDCRGLSPQVPSDKVATCSYDFFAPDAGAIVLSLKGALLLTPPDELRERAVFVHDPVFRGVRSHGACASAMAVSHDAIIGGATISYDAQLRPTALAEDEHAFRYEWHACPRREALTLTREPKRN